MNRFFTNLKHQAEENPGVALGVAVGLISSISQLANAYSNSKNSTTWRKEVKRRERKTK